ncbi:MAG: septum formation initiator [Frankiales bacterium]|nr:septum formation initiator [Frankiales bacterium]
MLAAVIAGCAAETAGRPVFLIDCDRLGGGIDVLLGAEQTPGPRWRQVRLSGGQLDPAVLTEALPSWQGVRFLAADDAAELDPDSITQVVSAAALAGPVIADLPRWPSVARAAALAVCDQVILVTPAEVRAVTASALVGAGLDPVQTVVAVRGVARSLPASRVGQLLGLPLLGQIPWEPACQHPAGLDPARLKRGTRALARLALELASSVAEGVRPAVEAVAPQPGSSLGGEAA